MFSRTMVGQEEQSRGPNLQSRFLQASPRSLASPAGSLVNRQLESAVFPATATGPHLTTVNNALATSKRTEMLEAARKERLGLGLGTALTNKLLSSTSNKLLNTSPLNNTQLNSTRVNTASATSLTGMLLKKALQIADSSVRVVNGNQMKTTFIPSSHRSASPAAEWPGPDIVGPQGLVLLQLHFSVGNDQRNSPRRLSHVAKSPPKISLGNLIPTDGRR